MAFLERRFRQPEIMDQPGLDPELHRHALRGLARINFVSGSVRILWKPLREFLRAKGGTVRVLDVGSGAGDVCIELWRRARRAGLPLEIDGCDVSPTALAFARNAGAEQQADVRFFEHDALRGDLPNGYDVVLSSLFLHHLDEPDAVGLLARMKQATSSMILINDLRRCRGGYLLAYFGTRLLSRSTVTHVDGPLSVEAAFTVSEAASLAEKAGLVGATVSKRWPCRYLLAWKRGLPS